MDPVNPSKLALESSERRGCRRLVWLALKFHGPATAARVERLLQASMSPEAVRGTIVELRREGKIRFARKIAKTPRGRWAKVWEIVP